MAHKLLLYIQPVYDYNNSVIEYAEILIREYRGISGVEQIMKFVKRTDSYDVFDLDIVKETLYILKSIPDLGYPVGINLCSKSLEVDSFADKVMQLIKESGVSKDKIILEINEYTKFSNKKVIENLTVFSSSDITLALDDFGIGNTNLLSSFINIKFDYIKIDKEFVDLDDNWDNKKLLLCSMKKICDSMSIKTVVEGIETPEQLSILRDLGYNAIQGYIITKPVNIMDYIKSNSSH